MTETDRQLAALLSAMIRCHRRLTAYAVGHLAVREGPHPPAGHLYLTDFHGGTMLRSESGVIVPDPEGIDVSEASVEAGVRPDPTGFEVWAHVELWAGERSTTGYPEGRHLLHEERRRCAAVPEAVAHLEAFVDRLTAVEDPLATVAWTRH